MKASIYFMTATLLLSSCAGSEESTEGPLPVSPTPQAVRVATVRQGPVLQGRPYLAEVVPARTVRVLAQVPGAVSELGAAQGVLVKEGASLVRISAPDVAARIARVRAERKRAERERDFACDLLGTDRVLARSGDLTTLQLDRSKKGCASAKLAVEAAQAAEREASVAGTKASERAPFAGEVLIHLVDEGQTVMPGMPLLQFASRERQLRLRVPRGDLRGITIGTRVASALGDGQVVEIGAQAQGPGRLIEVLARLDEEGEDPLALLPGTTTTATLVVAERPMATAVPERALARDGTSTYLLMVVNGDRLKKVEVETGPHQEGWIAIEPRLTEGTVVVVGGLTTLDLERPVLAVAP